MTLSARSIKGPFIVTLCPSKGRWYQHFETGICAQMGDVVSQDRAYTIDVLLTLLEMFEEEWVTDYLLFANSPPFHLCLHVSSFILPWWNERF